MFYLDDEEKEEVTDTEATVEETKTEEPKKEEAVEVEATRVESTETKSTEGKSKMAAGLLGIFLGSFGVHNFYLGNTGKAIGQLLLTLIGWIACGMGPLAAWVWGLVEGIMILTGKIDTDADGNPLTD